MKILLVNRAFYPDRASTARYLTDFALHLTQAGHQVTVLTGRCPFASSGPLYPPKETYQGIRIVRVWSFTFHRGKRWQRILDAFLVNLAFAWKLLWMRDFNVVVAMTTPPFVGWAAALLARWRKQKFFFWVMDLDPDRAIAMGRIEREGLPAYFLEDRLKDILARSERVIVLDRFMKQRLIGKETDPEKLEVCSLWADETEWNQIPHHENPFRKENGLEDKFVVMYSGRHHSYHPLTTLLKASRELKHDTSVIFLFYGDGDAVRDVLDFKAAHSLSNIKHLPYQERTALKYSLSAADLHIVTMGNSLAGVTHPSKIYNVLAVGRPVLYIGPRESSISDVLHAAGVGDQVEHGDVAGVVHAILKTKDLLPEQRTKIADQSLTAARTMFNRTQVMSRLLGIIEK